MFVKVTPRKKHGKTYYYAELVEAYREDGKIKHKRILYFGSVDLETANKLKIVFSKDFDSFTNLNKINFASSVPYGNFYVINVLCNQLGIYDFFRNSFISTDTHISVETAVEYLKAMVFQRIINPDSKLAFMDWVESTPLKHFVNVENFDLQTLYRSLEVLNLNFAVIEKYLYHLAVDKFKQEHKELFYDMTSSYFEGHNCIIAEYGYSRDKRRDKQQLVIGLVTTSDGFPVKCKIYPGNRPDKTTVAEVITELKQEYTIDEIVFVGDRGMLSVMSILRDVTKSDRQAIRNIPQHCPAVLYGRACSLGA